MKNISNRPAQFKTHPKVMLTVRKSGQTTIAAAKNMLWLSKSKLVFWSLTIHK